MGHAASILKNDKPIFEIDSENPRLANMGVVGTRVFPRLG